VCGTAADIRRRWVDSSHDTLSVRRQCELLELARSRLYYQAKPSTNGDVEILNQLRDIWESKPFYGYRRMTRELQSLGHTINHKRVQRLMALGGIQAVYPQPKTSQGNKAHDVYPYRLAGLSIIKPNQVWQVDITYLRLGVGWMYLVALIDVYSRYIVGWSLSNTLDTTSCIDALGQALTVGVPDIINSDQGCQFTSYEWTDTLKAIGALISMTGAGRCIDNIYIERFWRSVKQEAYYLHEYADVQALYAGIASYMRFYNMERWHQSLGHETPYSVYTGAVKIPCG